MGLKLFSASRIDDYINCALQEEAKKKLLDGDPNPYEFEILKSQQIGKYTIVEILYPNCKNYEGKKILVYQDSSIQKICSINKIDPHFLENQLSPIARFLPTKEGWEMAVGFCTYMSGKDE